MKFTSARKTWSDIPFLLVHGCKRFQLNTILLILSISAVLFSIAYEIRGYTCVRPGILLLYILVGQEWERVIKFTYLEQLNDRGDSQFNGQSTSSLLSRQSRRRSHNFDGLVRFKYTAQEKLLHCSGSSDPSLQSRSPSHKKALEMHFPSLHINWSVLQPTVEYVRVFLKVLRYC